MSHPCEQQTGFTLLELIVALAISSLVAVIGAAAMSSALDFYHRNAYRSAAREDVRAVERTIRYEWATRSKAVRSDGSMLEFETLFPVTGRASSGSTLAHVRYACETSPNEGIVLTHRVSSLPTGVPRIGQRPQPQIGTAGQGILVMRAYLAGNALRSEDHGYRGRLRHAANP